MSNGPVLFYDGTCGFCAASVQFILAHERRDTARFAALQSAAGDALRARHPELAGVDSMIWVEAGDDARTETVSVRSSAALKAAAYVGGPWRAALIGWAVPAPLRDAVYDLIARHRHRLLRGGERCFLPPASARSRFLEP